MRKRSKALAVAMCALVLALGVNATIAWLTDKTDSVTNTFTAGDVAITLTETWNTDSNKDGKNDSWTAQMIPGSTYTKDPVVAVSGDTNVDCYLFVKFEESDKASTYLTYNSLLTAEKGWTQGDGTTVPSNVWYRVVNVADSVKSWHLLKDDKVTVNATAVKKETMNEASAQTLAFTAYAVQKDNVTSAAAAWELINPATE